MREIFKPLFGNERLKTSLGEAIQRGTASHAYILDGPRGSGKHTAATLAAAALVCENRTDERFSLPCGVCPVCGRILKGISADVITVSKEDKASIGVGMIRRIREDLYVTPNDSDKKVYVIEEADLMTPQAQNALLISLEEPPPFVTFFLLTENVEGLLETVKSRAVTFRMELFSPEKIREYLSGFSTYGKNVRDLSERIDRAIEGSGGSAGEAKRIFEGSESKDESSAEKGRQLALLLVSGKTTDAVYYLIKNMPEGFESAKKVLISVSAILSRMIRFKKLPGSEAALTLTPEEIDAVRPVSVSRLVRLFDEVSGAMEAVSSNVMPKTVLFDMVFKCRN